MIQLAGIVCLLSVAIVDGLQQPKVEHSRSLVDLEDRPPYPWIGKNGDEQRTGFSLYGKNMTTLIGRSPTWAWVAKKNHIVRAAPLIDQHGNIFLASTNGVIHKFSRFGEILWEYKDTAPIPEVPAIYRNAVYFCNVRGDVSKLNMVTGELIWKKSALVKGATSSAGDTWSMTAGDGIIVSAVSTNGRVNDVIVAMHHYSGEIQWSYKPEKPVYNFLACVYRRSLLYADSSGRVYRHFIFDGKLEWKTSPRLGDDEEEGFTTGGAIIGPDGFVYVTNNVNHVTNVTVKTHGGINLSTKKSNHTGYVTKYRFHDGEEMWRVGTEYEANNGAAVARINNRFTVVVGVGHNPDMPDFALQLRGLRDDHKTLKEKKSRVYALDAKTGSVLWKVEMPTWHGWARGDTRMPDHVCLPDSFSNAAITRDGTALIGHMNGKFYAFNDKNDDGNIEPYVDAFQFNVAAAFQGSPAIGPGMIAAAPCNGLRVWLDPWDSRNKKN